MAETPWGVALFRAAQIAGDLDAIRGVAFSIVLTDASGGHGPVVIEKPEASGG